MAAPGLATLVIALAGTAPVASAAPVASFTTAHSGTPGKPDPGETVTFDASGSSDSGGTITSYSWDFGDGGTATGVTATHAFATSGNHTVTLTVTDDVPSTATATQTIDVNALPVAAGVAAAVNPLFGQNPLIPLVGQQVGLASQSTDADGSADLAVSNGAHYVWADSSGWVGDNSPNVIHPPYTSGGDKLVGLAVTDADDGPAAASIHSDAAVVVTVNTPPTADFIYLPQTPLVGESTTFAQIASDADAGNSNAHPEIGQITKYEWDLDGDGQYDDATGPSPHASFATAGPHTVGLRVTDGGGATDTIRKTVNVVTSRPSASFTAGPAFPLPGQAETFTSTSTPTAGQSITAVEWDFDYDPSHDSFEPSDVDATGATVSHVFTTPGPKTVGLRVTESGGGMDIVSQTVIVNAPPTAGFEATPSNPVAGNRVTFSSTSGDPDGPITQSWDLNGDGVFGDATGPVAARRFKKPGRYVVRLRVTDDHGASATREGIVNVARRPVRLLPNVNVHIAGRTTRTGAHLSMLRVRAPRGSRVVVRCSGRSCPLEVKRVKMHRKRVRIKKLQRDLRAGVVISVAVKKRGFVGRYVTFKIRRHAAPRRDDRCLAPGARRPIACPH